MPATRTVRKPTPTTGPAAVRAAEQTDVFGLGPGPTLAFVTEQRRRQDHAAAEELRGVAAWADHHRVDYVGSIDDEVAEIVSRPRPGVGDTLLGLEGELRLAGQGAFRVCEFAVCELAAALGMSEPAARAYVGQALELRDRLPRLWDAVMAGVLPAWKARKIAAETIPLSAAAADEVDRHLAPFAHKLSFGRILKAVDAAVLRHDPDLAAARAADAAEKRGVWVEDHLDGTSTINAVANTTDAAAFDLALDTVASDLAALGDTDSTDVRRAKALGVLADPQLALDLRGYAQQPDAQQSGQTAARRGGATIHVHLHTDAVETKTGTARVTGYGPRSFDAVQRWLADLAPGTAVTVTPVVDLTDHISVDAYEAPDRLRRQVEERDHNGCRFPWCGRQGRYDLDHINPYVPPDDGGPPGQTNTDNLARLCRFHHRVKTHGDWTYIRTGPTELLWTSRLGKTYLVDEHGTLPRADEARSQVTDGSNHFLAQRTDPNR